MYTKVTPVGEFGTWLKKKILDTEMAFMDFAEDIQLAPQAIRKHISEKTRPSLFVVNLYTDYFGDDFEKVYGLLLCDFHGINTSDFALWLWDNMTELCYSVETLSKRTGISKSNIFLHLSSRTKFYPPLKTVKKYCEAFGIFEPEKVHRLLAKDSYRYANKEA